MRKSPKNFKVVKEDGRIIDMHEYGLFVSSFIIPAPTPNHVTDTIDGRHGAIYQGTTLAPRKITVRLDLEATDAIDFDLLLDDLTEIFNPLESIVLVPDMQPGKRYKVNMDSNWEPEYEDLENGSIDLEFILYTVFSESYGTTIDLENEQLDKFQIAQGISLQENLQYVHRTEAFRIYNGGHIAINPLEHELKITFKGASKSLMIVNKTTKETWSYKGSTSSDDMIVIDGVESSLNSVNIFGDTNRKLISIAKGWNNIEVHGATGQHEISFDFRFLYLR